MSPDDQAQDFLARMSHELRTPLNAIQGYTEMLLEGKAAHHEDVPDLQGILRSAHRLVALVDAVLDLNQLRTGKFTLQPEPVNMVALTQDVRRAVLDQAQRHRTQVVVEVDPFVAQTDRRMVRQILFNLVDNAVRFTVRGRVSVEIRKQGQLFRIDVIDDGIGMTRAQIENATQPFWQGDMSSTRRYDGAGMGLAVCNGLAEALGGSLAIESRMGDGAKITVLLPIETEAAASEWDDFEEDTVLLR